jgi:hypothetical protein
MLFLPQLFGLFLMPVASIIVLAQVWSWLLPPTDIPAKTRS